MLLACDGGAPAQPPVQAQRASDASVDAAMTDPRVAGDVSRVNAPAYAYFEDVPAAAYEAVLRPHYGTFEGVRLHHPVTIGGIPCAAGGVELHSNFSDDRCGETEHEATCRRAAQRDFERWKAEAGIKREGYAVAACVVATTVKLDGITIPAGARIALHPNGHLAEAELDGRELLAPR